MKTRLLIYICVIFLLDEIRDLAASKKSSDKVKHLLENICDHLHDEDLSSTENQNWLDLCEKWLQSTRHHQRQNLNIIDEEHMQRIHQLRRSGSRGSSRTSSRSSRSSSSSSSSTRRISTGATRFRNTRTGTVISRPSGWLWSRSRHVFLPVSRLYRYRSRSSSPNRYTTSATTSSEYYYCTLDANSSAEIQCLTTTGDNQCCEVETIREVYCCGGDIDSDYDADNQGRRLLTRIFYTISAIAFVMHIFMRRFNR
ncbi:unnamed protein product [Adineta ricciae]|uniref:Uncharacterized protein n=1 Tax=Adineta ricciae TaxID=249248 RepID=A0A814W7W6_ADIRI|nr:unnamed protein product [Adineta ricciae]